jgi:hypothetical protein
VVLPPYGFFIEAPSFVAFYAQSFNGLKYDWTPALFTLRGLDGTPIKESAKVRVFHGFGDERVKVGAAEVRVPKEAVVPGR